MHPRRVFAFLVVSTAFALAGLSTFGQDIEKPETENKKPDSIVVTRDETVENVDKDLLSNNQRYTIGFEDILQIDVYRHPELSQTVSVGRDGTIILPRIKQPITAVCKSERELASLISALYRSYLRDPFVNVRALDRKSQPFAVIGAVKTPGPYYSNRRIRLLELLAQAGGPDYERSAARVQVARVGNISACRANNDEPGEVQFFSYSITEVMKGNENPYMQPGDIVSILEASEAYVIGNVDEPTTILLKEPTTLTEAIAKAGGLGNAAKSTRVVIQRRDLGSKTKTELVFDLKDIRARTTPDPYLQANDIVEVPTSNVKLLRNGLLKVLTGGLSNLFYRFPL